MNFSFRFVLNCELCRLHRFAEIVIVTLIFSDVVPQSKLTWISPDPLCCLTLSLVSLFSFQGAFVLLFQPRLKPDLKVQFVGL